MNRLLSRCSGVSRRAFTAPLARHMSVVPNGLDEFKTTDGLFDASRVDESQSWDPTGRTHQYVVVGGAKVVYASLARLGVMKIVSSLSATADVLALGTVEVDVSAVEEGTGVTIKWRGKPVFIKHRTAAEIAKAQADDAADMRDPQTDADRVVDPKYMIVLGICTHLGCVPTANAGDYGAWFCPCHGSHYDLSGRIRKGPAPLNLEVPEYTLNGTLLKLGS
jgi:ubiquinol-cytochrome c reductase iron-sulfur subunit